MGGVGDAQPGAAPGLYLVVSAEEVDALFERAVAAGASAGYRSGRPW